MPARRASQGGDTLFLASLLHAGFPEPVLEHRFSPPRRWRFDYAWPHVKVALEVEGGVWTGGRHTRPSGYSNDCEKYSEAAVQGWIVLRVLPDWLTQSRTLDWLERAFRSRREVKRPAGFSCVEPRSVATKTQGQRAQYRCPAPREL